MTTTAAEVPFSIGETTGDSTDAALFEGIVDGAYVVVCRSLDDRFKRRVYLNLPAAEKAAQRASERGVDVAIVLARLVPVRTGWVR
ncbi:hypothetical protein [Jiangella mangrovi]|uniref:Uncharacterized protein n=1 Tax=Jiangella mangrovi TaxID=1524084 RepID=A0A7W9LJF0_9ACTN|nr:hypothetical protein [Jiangella mangrovi]MBB5785983.1 hypothetical protein [Jiangella mangrovi]